MGIPGLWAELAPAAQTTTLPSYCLTTFTDNANSVRGLRLGIDASLWLFHALQSSGGVNPYLRLLFYRLAKLLSLPVLPLFVFDGANRPTWKRGKQVKGRQHAIEQPFAQLIEAFGFRWHRAQGEAEAELAYLNRVGLVDAVLIDDSDALLFGAQVLIRNWGKNLSGTKSLSRTTLNSSDVVDEASTILAVGSHLQLSGSDRDHLITLYRATDLAALSELGIDRDGLILIALMSGGDYDATGLMQCGVKIALALARAGLGTNLVKAFKDSYPTQASVAQPCATFSTFLTAWLEEVRDELRTNSRGYLPSRRPKLASSIVQSFLSTADSRKVLAYYVYPLTSEHNTAFQFVQVKCTQPDLTRLAGLCQLYFNWTQAAILTKFRTILGPGIVVRRLRQEVLEHHDGGGVEGPWAALVESPASKAVRRHMLGLDPDSSQSSSEASKASKAAAITALRKKQKPLHDSPNATRITDFFAKAALASNPTDTRSTTTATATTASTSRSDPMPPELSVEIMAIKMQRRHAALAPFLDYRVLVSMSEFAVAAQAGIDPRLDAELAAAHAADDDSDADAVGVEEDEAGSRGPTKKRIEPGEPLLMWIPEPFLQLSLSGSAPLDAFVKQVERKAAAATKPKGGEKVRRAAKAGQMTLNAFVEPLAKASLSATSANKASNLRRTDMPPSASQPSGKIAPRTPRQLRIPSGMQRTMRRTESVPVATPLNASARGLDRTTSLPERAEQGSMLDVEEDMDSSIEFLGSFVANSRSTGIHDRSRTPPNMSSDADGNALENSPKKRLCAATTQVITTNNARIDSRDKINARNLPSSRALAEPSADSDDDDDDDNHHVVGLNSSSAGPFSPFGGGGCGGGLVRSAATDRASRRPRVSTITISDSSDQD
ncbi:uncharacterized protein MEPE_02551 [Melanopsichium pennsylvanicum]|uniref:XPG-I domain-containing protein n=2 Tax=Melanopsichium pennsylvanicum TaxID=63383 RepID=A0AAJ4XMN5_9BASI|nr:conserved hypothetical protein [Melanopsichium pennsylvanicum 4]SNX83843.1 uncharacterized protein MEPE_02551 [Melanopsichium pennsylvanicum]